jgi:nicotinamidase-related amidase
MTRALLVIDMQKDSISGGFYAVPTIEQVIGNVERLADAFRARELPVVYTQHTYRPDGSDLQRGEPVDASGAPIAYREGTEGWEIIEELRPRPGDVVVRKHRWNAFSGSRLDTVLRRLRVEEVVITGVTTDCCVMLTAFDAWFHEYGVILIPDATAAVSEGSHQAAVLTMLNWLYDLRLVTTEGLLQELAGGPPTGLRTEGPDAFPFDPRALEETYRRAVAQA